jgi:hemolysin activation/secretion protein
VPLSHLGASSHFSRIEGQLSLREPIGRATFILTARGQSAFGRPMFLSEQFTLASADGVSALTPGSVNADSGLSVRAELSRTLLPVGQRGWALQPYIFGASGLGWLHRATAAETASLSLQGLGAGLRLYPDARRGRLAFSFELGRSFGRGLLADEDRLRANLSAHLGL